MWLWICAICPPPQRASSSDLNLGSWRGAELVNTHQQMDPHTLESGTKIKYVLSLSVYFITHRVLVVVFLSCYHSHLCHRCVLHRCMVRAPYSSPLGLYTKVSSWTTCSTAPARTPSQTDAFTTVNFAKTGKKKNKKCFTYFLFHEKAAVWHLSCYL